MRKAYNMYRKSVKSKQYQTVLIKTGFILQIQWNPTLWPPSYSFPSSARGTLFWSEQEKSSQLFSYLKNPFNTANPLH